MKEGINGLCSGCFSSHFPQPNMKNCKFKNTPFPIRLRGGAHNEGSSMIVQKAVLNAKFHGINVHRGVENLANGNCAFETILDSINTRDCFGETLDGTPELLSA